MALYFRTFADYDKWRRQQLARRLQDQASKKLMMQVTGPRGTFKGGAMSQGVADGIAPTPVASDGVSVGVAQGIAPAPVPSAPVSPGIAQGISQSEGVGVGEGSDNGPEGPGSGSGTGGLPSEPDLWSPDQIAGLELWLDADDADTITLNGSDVSQWDDKSDSGMVFTQGTAANQPAYTTFLGKPSVFYNASSAELLLGARTDNNGPDLTVFAMCWRDYGTASFPTLISTFTNGSWLDGWSMTDPGGSGGILVMAAGTYNANNQNIVETSDDYPTPVGTWTPDVNHWQICMGAFQIGGGANSIQGFVNGEERTGSANDTEDVTDFNTSIYIGNNVGGNYSWDGHIGEILTYDSTLSTADRQLVEGYLAWKWVGSGNYLPTGHPYKDAAPT